MRDNLGLIYVTLLAIWSIGGLIFFLKTPLNLGPSSDIEKAQETLDGKLGRQTDLSSGERKTSSEFAPVSSTAYPIDTNSQTEYFSMIVTGLRLCIQNRNDIEAFNILREFYELARKHKLMSRNALDEYWQLITEQKAKKTRFVSLNASDQAKKTWSAKQVPMLNHILNPQHNGK